MKRRSSLPPAWKIWREVRRLGRQSISASVVAADYLFSAKYYDLSHAKKARNLSGAIAASDKVAIFLIFPDLGLQASHMSCLKYLVAKGYAPLVVSNLPLAEADCAEVRALCWRYLERVNFGYDFGGYRDAVLSIGSGLKELKRLIILNDSSWFPLPGARDWIDDAEALGVDFAGATSHFGTPRPELSEYRSITWSFSTQSRNFHYGSFALLIGERILSDPRFRLFWKKLPLTNNKKRVVRWGENGITRWVLRRGYSHATTLNVAKLDKDLEELATARIRELADNLILFSDPRLINWKRSTLQEIDPNDRRSMISLILTATSLQGVGYAPADFLISEQGFPFLKKSPVWLNEEASDATLRIAARLPGPDGAAILDEAQKLRIKKSSLFDKTG